MSELIQEHYEEMDCTPYPFLIKSLDRVIETINYDRNKVSSFLNSDVTKEYALHQVSEEYLVEIEKQGNREVATKDCSLLKFNNITFPSVDNAIAIVFKGKIKQFGVSGRIWYPPNGFMGWHTNSNNKGYRLYCVYAREGEKSFFRYKNPSNGEIITSWDKKGWNFRIFKIGEKMLWHSIYSDTDRFSIGYALYS